MNEAIVVTGLGAVSPLGTGVATNWKRLIAGQSGIRTNTRFGTDGWKCRIAGLVLSQAEDAEGFDPEAAMDPRDVRRTDLFIHYAMAAAQEALHQANWHPESTEGRIRTATVIEPGWAAFRPSRVLPRQYAPKGCAAYLRSWFRHFCRTSQPDKLPSASAFMDLLVRQSQPAPHRRKRLVTPFG